MTEEESIRKLLYILSMSDCGMKWIVEWTLVRLPVDRVVDTSVDQTIFQHL